MNRFLQVFNLMGIVVLVVLCAAQWKANSVVNLRAGSLEIVRQKQQQKLDDDQNTIKGYAADLDDFRQRLTLAESQLKDLETKLNTVTAERNQLAVQTDQLKTALGKWMAAVNDRDAALKHAGDQLQKLAADRNDAVQKFNDLAAKYNSLANDWNTQQAKQ